MDVAIRIARVMNAALDEPRSSMCPDGKEARPFADAPRFSRDSTHPFASVTLEEARCALAQREDPHTPNRSLHASKMYALMLREESYWEKA